MSKSAPKTEMLSWFSYAASGFGGCGLASFSYAAPTTRGLKPALRLAALPTERPQVIGAACVELRKLQACRIGATAR